MCVGKVLDLLYKFFVENVVYLLTVGRLQANSFGRT